MLRGEHTLPSNGNDRESPNNRPVLAMSCARFEAAQAEMSDPIVRTDVLNDISGVFRDTNG
jgi:hypothetical protein